MLKTNKISQLITNALLILAVCSGLIPGSAVAENQYFLDTGDQVRVTVFNHPDLSGDFEINGEGTISLPLVQDVNLQGLSVKEAVTLVISKLKPAYLRNPRVSIDVLNYRPFFIIGEVKQPGSYPYMSGLTVLSAVAVAGGYTRRANSKGVMITRGSSAEKNSFQASAVTKVLPGDVIEIKESLF